MVMHFQILALWLTGIMWLPGNIKCLPLQSHFLDLSNREVK